MVVKVFWQDPYCTGLDTHIVTVSGNDVTVAATVFYAESGGQESDEGTLGGRRVLAARKCGDDIVYTLADGHGLETGDPVRIEIDWARRYRLMRLHFAAEIVLELVCAQLPGIGKIGAHIAVDKARIDFLHDSNIGSLFASLLPEVGALVAADLPIVSAFSDEAAGRRYWEIAGVGRVPCGGTHLRRTGEIGPVTLKRRNVGKGKERIEIFVGDSRAG